MQELFSIIFNKILFSFVDDAEWYYRTFNMDANKNLSICFISFSFFACIFFFTFGSLLTFPIPFEI